MGQGSRHFMALSSEFVSKRFKAIRSRTDGAKVSIRHEGNVFEGLRTTLTQEEVLSGYGSHQKATGAVRLAVDELKQTHPIAGDLIEIKEAGVGEWLQRVVVMPRYDQMRATVKLEYGEQYG
jgi:hypothetical protein